MLILIVLFGLVSAGYKEVCDKADSLIELVQTRGFMDSRQALVDQTKRQVHVLAHLSQLWRVDDMRTWIDKVKIKPLKQRFRLYCEASNYDEHTLISFLESEPFTREEIREVIENRLFYERRNLIELIHGTVPGNLRSVTYSALTECIAAVEKERVSKYDLFIGLRSRCFLRRLRRGTAGIPHHEDPEVAAVVEAGRDCEILTELQSHYIAIQENWFGLF